MREKITVLTPTFNREYLLRRLYKSLIMQQRKDFQWLIVDDGSTDNTETAVKEFKSDFPIVYIKKENGGKHTAINEGIKYISTEYTFVVDSDDYLTNDAIELVYRWIADIEDVSNVAGVAGVSGRVINAGITTIGDFPQGKEYVECFNTDRKKYHLNGDKAEIYKTKLLKKYPFPTYDDEKFVPESVVWNRFSLDGLKVRWYKDCIKICEYKEDGLTAATKSIDFFKDNYKGYRDDCTIGFMALRFPYNYSLISVYYARCIAADLKKNCLEHLELNFIQKSLIKGVGKARFIIGRY